ncbi:MAG: restriction endonuclease subunit S [Syntrophorhabdaceae bacterium]|nr:restriction endonuclease subunit S [Syntrophorhabdaceae bacterium]MDD5243393.1 restriction endonuclease subunit S [Syntrophorhabdaceae bacterium]
MKRKPYPAYKPPGVEWLGDVPEHWKVKKVRRCLLGHKQGYYSTEAYVDEGYKLLRITDLDSNGFVSLVDCPSVEIKEDARPFLLQDNDFVFARTGGAGTFGLIRGIKDKTVFASYLIRFRFSKEADPEFLRYNFLSMQFVQAIIRNIHGGVNQNVHAEDIKEQYIPLPPFPEQKAIADFLDRETGKIDMLIGKNRWLIELLKEKRIALISRAVTKGLDSTVKMKSSSVEWLGDVPGHWEVKKIRRVATRVQTGNTPPTSEEKYYDDGTVPWFGPSSFGEGIFLSEPVKVINECAVEDGVARLFNAGTVMLVCIGATIGKVSSIKENASCNQQITGVTFRDTLINTEFITFQLKLLETTIREVAPSATLAIFDQNKISDLQLALPPLPEQQAIADFLDKETEKIDALIAKVEKAIEKLKEYRTALISAAVTGKIDVREAA